MKSSKKTPAAQEDRSLESALKQGRTPENKRIYHRKDGLPGVRVTGGSYSGHIRFHGSFHSRVLGNDRPIWIYLPPGYEKKPGKRFPVLYMQDGQNVFARETSYAGVDWAADEAAENLISRDAIVELIIVAVSNTPDRESEYTHVPDSREGGGNLDNYARFLIEELKPFIDSNYRTVTNALHTGIMGSSLGGLSAIYLGWAYPEHFGLVAGLSPSLWWAGGDLISRIKEDPRKEGPFKIYTDMGSMEGQDRGDLSQVSSAVLNTRELFLVFLQKGYIFGHDLYYVEAVGQDHNEWFWSRRIYLALMALYGKGRHEQAIHCT
jgi:predicted alpha/beta superfamily hydrolase